MKSKLTAGLLLPVVAFAASLQMRTPKADEVVAGEYVGEGGQKIEVLGVCSISPDKVECWDATGARSDALTKRVESYCMGESNSEVPFRFGQENRYVVFESTPGAGASFEVVGFQGSSSLYWRQGGPTRVVAVRVSVAPDVRSTEITGAVSARPTECEIAFKMGATTVFGGETIEVGPSQAERALPERRELGYPFGEKPTGKSWSFVLGYDRADRAPDGSGVFTLLDKDAKEIRYVDLDGEPITPLEFLARGGNTNDQYQTWPELWDATVKKPNCALARVVPLQRVSGAVRMLCNVDPERIGYLHIVRQNQKTILFKDIPLDARD